MTAQPHANVRFRRASFRDSIESVIVYAVIGDALSPDFPLGSRFA